ncbi:MAG: PRC-barrel domain-containing protein [Actinomycetota bacterium]|nr:PRC-barrel domain-containing protein [Actinomycetota bacterium]
MAQTGNAAEPGLVKFSDLRDKGVFALNDEEIGTVKDLYIDEHERELRYLEVGAGGFLGIGQRPFLIPIQAVSGMSAERVTLNQSREKVLDSPEFAPGHVLEAHDRQALSRHYGFPPVIPPG